MTHLYRKEDEGHLPFEHDSVLTFPSDVEGSSFVRSASQLGMEIDERTVALDYGINADFISLSNKVSAVSSSSGRAGYCWPGHPEIEREWKYDQLINAHHAFKAGEFLPITNNSRPIKDWSADGDGKGYSWHNASAGDQIGEKATYAYGAIASCLGMTRWWISYRTHGDWQWLLNGWECPAGGVGFWRIPSRTWRKRRFLGLLSDRRGYLRFDVRFRAESSNDAFHRYYISFGTYSDP